MFKEFNRLFNQNPLQTNIWETDETILAEHSQRISTNNDRLEKKYLEALELAIQEAYEVGRLLYNHMYSNLFSDHKKVTYKFKSYLDLPVSGIVEHLYTSLNEKRLFSLNEAFAIIKTIINIQNETNMRFFDVTSFEKKFKLRVELNEHGLICFQGQNKAVEIQINVDK